MSTQSLTREMAAENAKDIVPAFKRALSRSKKANLGILGGAIACTYWHQASHLATLPGFSAGSVNGFDLSLGYIAPLVWDLSMVVNANTLQTQAIDRKAKTRATVMMASAGALSMAVNVTAGALPADAGPWISRILFALLVLLAVGQKWAGAAIKADYAALAVLEAAAGDEAKAIAPAPVEGRKCPEGCTCGKHAPKTPAKRPTRKSTAKRTRRTPNTPAQFLAEQSEVAPVSPAPTVRNGQTTTGLWVATR